MSLYKHFKISIDRLFVELSPVRHSWMLNVHLSLTAGQYAFILKIQAGSHATLRTKI
jgi:hypothetical protein